MKDLVRKRNELLRRFERCSQFVRGSINSVCAACNRARCTCEKKTPRRAYRLTYKDSQQKTRIVYVPRSRLPTIRKMVANYSRSRTIIEQLIETNLEMFKRHADR
jgi:hypothetical protein